jgi:RNA polymerase sigma-70 factor, ECF subfamily
MTTLSLIEPRSAPAGAVSDADLSSFQTVRPRLFGIAYRVLGSACDADDVVQDTWLRWQGTDRREVRNTDAFLATTATRLALNVLQSAHMRHETHIEQDEDAVDRGADPALNAQQRDALERALRALLETTSPAERAVYVLREAFDYPYRRIAEVLSLSEANARQLATRARRSLAGGAGRSVGAFEHRRLLDAVDRAARTGDLAALERLLVADAGGADARVAA